MEQYYKYDEGSTYLQMHALPATAAQNGDKKVQNRFAVQWQNHFACSLRVKIG